MTRTTTPPLAPADLGTILSVWAHPDDETYLAGAVMAAAVDAGQRVVCVSATAGELGTDDPANWPPARLGQLRRWEAAAAMAVIGVADHRFLDLPDGGLAELDTDHPAIGVELIGALIDEVRPDTILTFGPDGMTFHPDHIAIGRWTTDAWERRGGPGRLLHASTTAAHIAEYRDRYEEWGVYMTDDRPVAPTDDALALRFVATGADLDRKLAALAAMASQTDAARAALPPATYAAMAAEEAFVAAEAATRRTL